jgi:hypothetical protein
MGHHVGETRFYSAKGPFDTLRRRNQRSSPTLFHSFTGNSAWPLACLTPPVVPLLRQPRSICSLHQARAMMMVPPSSSSTRRASSSSSSLALLFLYVTAAATLLCLFPSPCAAWSSSFLPSRQVSLSVPRRLPSPFAPDGRKGRNKIVPTPVVDGTPFPVCCCTHNTITAYLN